MINPGEESPLELGLINFPKYRPGQLELVNKAVEAFQQHKKRYVFLDLPVGIGKSIIGQAIIKKLGIKGVFSSFTKSLQDQFNRDFSDFSVMLKGKSNYPCILTMGENTAEDCIDGTPLEDGEVYHCDLKISCPYFMTLKSAKESDMPNLNFSNLIPHINFTQAFAKRPIYILDEADTLEDIIRDFYKVGISIKDVIRMAELGSIVPEPKWEETSVEYWKMWVETCFIPSEIINALTFNKEKKALKDISKFETKLENIRTVLSQDWLIRKTIDRRDESEGTEFIPLDSAIIAKELVFNQPDSLYLIMSATLSSKEIFCRTLGIPPEETEYIASPSPFPKERRPFLYFPIGSMTAKSIADTWPSITKAIVHTLEVFSSEQVIIHTTRTDLADELTNILNLYYPTQPGQPEVVRMYTSSKPWILEDFEKGLFRVLVSPSIKRGVDFKGNKCRINIITKMPFLSLGDPYIEKKAKRDPEWYDWRACQEVQQEYGRSTRDIEDYSITLMFDSSFKNFLFDSKKRKVLNKWFLEAVQTPLVSDFTKAITSDTLTRASQGVNQDPNLWKEFKF